MRKLISLLIITVLSIGAISASAQQQIAGLVKVVQPGLEIQRSGTQEWVTISMESIIGTGDRIRTTANGKAEVALFSRSALMEMHPNTELSINRMERNEQGYLISIGLVTGKLHQALLPVPETYIGYEFTTATTNIVTAGGIFDVWLDGSQNTNVLTSDGIVYVGASRTQLGAAQGVRAEAGGALSEIINATTAEQLNAGIDGIPASFATDGDVQLNVRQGPNTRTELMGTVFPSEIKNVKGVSADGEWYRIKHGRGHGWVSQNALSTTIDTQHLVVYPVDYIESLVVAEVAPAVTPATTTIANASNAILQDFTPIEVELMAKLNEWRINDGLWPLKPNTVLRDMAYSQGNYLLSLASLPDDLHVDAKGRNPRQRALDPSFNWPHYLGADRMAIGENIYIGNNMAGAINYWRNSKIHHDTTVSVGFREIGVAILPHPLGSMYVVVFGARPNVLPVLIDPLTETLYISPESYRYASPGDWVTKVEGVQFIESVLTPVNQGGWFPWARNADRPENQTFVVAYQGDESKLLMTNFDPQHDIAWLPSNLSLLEASVEPTAAPQAMLEVPQLQVPVVGNLTPTPTPGPNGQNASQAAISSVFATKTPVPPTGG